MACRKRPRRSRLKLRIISSHLQTAKLLNARTGLTILLSSKTL
jgi:hypothetical protein